MLKLKIKLATTTLLIVELVHTHVLLLYLLRPIIKKVRNILLSCNSNATSDSTLFHVKLVHYLYNGIYIIFPFHNSLSRMIGIQAQSAILVIDKHTFVISQWNLLMLSVLIYAPIFLEKPHCIGK